MIKINKRLEKISAFIEDNSNVIDIGCDHGLLGIYLKQTKSNIKVIDSDISSGPLAIAYNNLVKYHLEDEIEIRKGNGLETISDDIDTVVISGMGSHTILEILQSIDKYPNIKKIIISPNNDFSLTRREIKKLGWYLINEEISLVDGKYYLISVYTKKENNYDNYFGLLNKNDSIVIDYYRYIYNNNLEIINKIGNSKRKEELIKENNLIKENINI